MQERACAARDQGERSSRAKPPKLRTSKREPDARRNARAEYQEAHIGSKGLCGRCPKGSCGAQEQQRGTCHLTQLRRAAKN